MSAPQRKMIIMILTVLITSGLIVYFIILPTVKDIKKITASVYAERLDLEKKYLRGQLLKATVENFEKVKDQLPLLAASFVAAGQELNFIQTLENIANRHQIDQDLKLNTEQLDKKTGDPATLPFSLTLHGTFGQTMDYLQDLERLNLYLIISEFDIAAVGPSQQRQQGLVNVVLTGKVYHLTASQE